MPAFAGLTEAAKTIAETPSNFFELFLFFSLRISFAESTAALTSFFS
jgi:hypothetical protein